MLFNPTQADVRRFFCSVRSKMKNDAPMEAIETLASLWIAEHPEYFAELDDVDAAAITGNYAVPAGLNPLKDGLVKEGAESVYTCLVVVRRPDAGAAWARKLASGYAAPEVRRFVEEKFGGAVIVGA